MTLKSELMDIYFFIYFSIFISLALEENRCHTDSSQVNKVDGWVTTGGFLT